MAENAGTQKKFEIVEVDGKELRKYSDGSIRNANGMVVKQSAERAKLMAQRRKIKGVLLAGQAIQEATNADSVEDGVKEILKKRAEVAMTDNGRAGNDAAKLVLVASQFLQNEKKVDVNGEVQHRAVVPELPREYLQYLEKLANEKVIDGTAEDVE